MIDFHSHVLPGIDDGSRSVEESLQLLQMLRQQGIDTVAATPHFYATCRTPTEFLERRQRAFERLMERWTNDLPEIRLGGELLYYPGISRMKELPDLCLQGTDLLLLEMSTETWSDYTVQEIVDLIHSRNVTVLLAHIERYLPMQKARVWEELLENGVLMQCNAEFFLSLRTRRKAAAMLRDGRIHLLGSDCHNVDRRPPRLNAALERIRKYAGEKCLAQLDQRGWYYLNGMNR